MSHNPSFLRTDRAIYFAFIRLLNEKSFEKITVQDILDKTPVTRATFYAHYRDKHEIAEKMLNYFLRLRDQTRKELNGHAPSQLIDIVKKHYIDNKELIQALLKIKTETVNLRQTITDEFIQEYLQESHSKNKLLEARIYAEARTELELAHLYDDRNYISFDESNEIFLNVLIKLLRLSDDKEVKQFMKSKIAKSKGK